MKTSTAASSLRTLVSGIYNFSGRLRASGLMARKSAYLIALAGLASAGHAQLLVNPLLLNTGITSSYTGTKPLLTNDNIWMASNTSSVSGYVPAVVCGNQAPTSWINSPYGNADWISYPHTCQPGRPAAHICEGSIDIYYRARFPIKNSVCGKPLTALNPGDFCLAMDFYADNCVADIWVNGVLSYSTTMPLAGQYFALGYSATGRLSFSDCSNWIPGMNEIIVHVRSAPDLEGFLCQANLVASNVPDETMTPFAISSASMPSPCQATQYLLQVTPVNPAYTYQWQPGATPGTSLLVTPAATTAYTVTAENPYGCKATQTVAVTPANTPATSAIAFKADTVCLHAATRFTNMSTVLAPATFVSWAWDFDNDGTTDDNSQHPGYTFATAGTHMVKLEGVSSDGCRSSVVSAVVVKALPTAAFAPVNACVNTAVALNNSSSAPVSAAVTSYSWNFGPGATPLSSTLPNPGPVYTASGIHTIGLAVTASNGCSAVLNKTVDVYPQPVAAFVAGSVCQSLPTAFTDQSVSAAGTITAWQWDFTDDRSVDDATQHPSHTFAASGTYTTALVVTSSNGCNDTARMQVNVWGHSRPDFSPDKVCFGTATTFSNLSSAGVQPNTGTIASYTWDFGDGSGSTAANPSHTYTGANANASYVVRLTATTSHNCADNVSKTVNVFALPTASFISDSVCLGSPSHLLNASNGNGNTVNSYAWDFLSDGSTDVSGIANPSYVFPRAGNNAVTYTVSSSPAPGLVCSHTTGTIPVWVHPLPVPDFSIMSRCINAQPNTLSAAGSSIAIGTNTAYAWSYGDGATGTGLSASHAYASPGVYQVTLTVTSNKGCRASLAKAGEVYRKPLVSLANSAACDGKAMSFTATAQAGSGTITAWNWDLDNVPATIEATGPGVTYTFPGPGAHTVALIAETDKGCRDTLPRAVYVDYVPVPRFTVDRPAGCPVHCVSFTDQTPALTGPARNMSWQWSFGDGSSATAGSNAGQSHCYTNTSGNRLAQFDVKLVVSSDKGCVDSLRKPAYITVYPKPTAAYETAPNPADVVAPLVYFTNRSQDYTRWWWNFGDDPRIRDSVDLHPAHFYGSETAQVYHSFLVVANSYGCLDTAYAKTEVAPEFVFYIPNTFTPSSSDGINDFFTGKGIGIEAYEMWIFDRWGEAIYYTNDIQKGWDGRNQKHRNEDTKQDVYVWKVVLKDVFHQQHEYVGHVLLLK